MFFLSFFFFVDDFEFYRNSYKSLMKIYIQIIVFKFYKCMRRVNVFFLTLDSHDNNFNDIINSLYNLRFLNKKIVFELSQFIRVCVFTLCFFNDIS